MLAGWDAPLIRHGFDVLNQCLGQPDRPLLNLFAFRRGECGGRGWCGLTCAAGGQVLASRGRRVVPVDPTFRSDALILGSFHL